jgi:hypothetical protein
MHPDFVPSIFIDRTGQTLHGMETLARTEIVRWLSAIGMKSVYQFDLVSKLPIDAKQPVPEQKPATPAPVVAVGASDDVKPTSNAPAWRLIPSLARAPGYRWPLYQFLHAAYIAGQPCPKARDFLEWLKSNPDPELQVMPDGLKYDGAGNPKEADLKAIQQAIKGMLQK